MEAESLWTPSDGEAVIQCRSALDEGDLGLALLALEAAAGAECIAVMESLRSWSSRVRENLRGDLPSDHLAALRTVLVDEEGITGEGESFYDPRNCQFVAVMERRRGMPILLSSIWLIVARMAGISAAGIGMPGHFIIRLGGEDGMLVDPFGGGRALTVDRCATIVSRLCDLEWKDDYLAETNNEGIVARVVRNLQICFHREKERLPLYRMARFNALLLPDCPAAQLLHAQVAEILDFQPLAVPIYRTLVADSPESEEATIAAERIRALEFEGPEVH